jgi:hypothetical protein
MKPQPVVSKLQFLQLFIDYLNDRLTESDMLHQMYGHDQIPDALLTYDLHRALSNRKYPKAFGGNK